MSGERILVVDDRQENLVFLADSVLRPEGYEVITAMDGKEALDKALAEQPDLIITDLKMPRLTGLEMMAALHKAGVNIPVILTTFYGSEQTALQAFRMGAKDYVIKPYDLGEMLKSVERALIEQRLRRETMHLKEGVAVRRYLEERVRQLHSLCGIGKALNALHEPDEVMRVAVEAAIHLAEASRGELFLVNPEAGQVELRAVRGPSDARAMCVRRVSTDQVAAQVIKTGQALIVPQNADEPEQVSRLVVPLRAGEEIIGILAVDAKPAQTFDENDRYQLGILSNFTAVALVNAQLIAGFREEAAIQSQRLVEEPEDLSPTLKESISEVRRLSGELRKLADAAQVVATKLQGPGRP
jgi:two-component system NtrC family sensor kinase